MDQEIENPEIESFITNYTEPGRMWASIFADAVRAHMGWTHAGNEGVIEYLRLTGRLSRERDGDVVFLKLKKVGPRGVHSILGTPLY